MSGTTAGYQGMEAVKNKQWEKAIPLLDKALEDSNSPAWLLARCQAHQQLKNYEQALDDACLAYHSAAERGSGNSRKQMIEAQYRRALVYYKMGRYADADCCAKWSMLLAEGRPAREDDGVEKNVDANGNYTVTWEDAVADTKGQPGQANGSKADILANATNATGSSNTGFESDWKRAYTLRSQILGMMRTTPEDHPGRKVTVTKVPPKPEKKVVKQPEPASTIELTDGDNEPAQPKPELPAPGSVPDEKMKSRVDYYQTNQTITISFFVKDVKKENLQVRMAPKQIQLSPLPRAVAPYVQPGDREATSTLLLAGEIDPSASRWTVTPRKIELTLQKATPGVKWATWGTEVIGPQDDDTADSSSSSSTPAPTATTTAAAPAPAPAASKPTAPVYPTSSRKGPKDWDTVSKEMGGDEEDANDVNYFFKQLYKGATPDQRRAMVKSFIESNGTALSTDWEDVKNRKVETVPPEGVEPKKWES